MMSKYARRSTLSGSKNSQAPSQKGMAHPFAQAGVVHGSHFHVVCRCGTNQKPATGFGNEKETLSRLVVKQIGTL